MNAIDFIKAHGCTCFRAGKDIDPGEVAITIGGKRLVCHAGVDWFTHTTLVSGAGERPRVARRRRPWLRARRRAMRRTGRPPVDRTVHYVRCLECGAAGETSEDLT